MASFVAPSNRDFKKIQGKITDGIHLRCGNQCNCPGGGSRCSGTCANCKKHVDMAFIKVHSARTD